MAESSFDPRRHLRRVHLQGQTVDYLDVKWRLVWLRTEQPEAQITTEHVQLTPEGVVFRATVAIPGGGSATGYGSGVDVESAESAALGRALLALGFGTVYAPDHVLAAEAASPVAPTPASAMPTAQAPATPTTEAATPGDLPAGVTVGPGGGRALPPKLAAIFAQAQPIIDEPPVDETPAELPASTPPAPVDAAGPATDRATPPPPANPPPPAKAVREQPPASAASPAAPAKPVNQAGPPPPAMPTVRRSETPARDLPPSLTTTGGKRPPAEPVPRSVLGRSAVSVDDDATDDDQDDVADDEAHQADNDWSAFWPWARSRGYFNRDDIEKAIGQPIRSRTPREIRTLILNLDDA